MRHGRHTHTGRGRVGEREEREKGESVERERGECVKREEAEQREEETLLLLLPPLPLLPSLTHTVTMENRVEPKTVTVSIS